LKSTPPELSINLKSAKALSLNNTALATWRADASNETARFPLLAQSGYCLCIQSPVPRAAIALWRSGFLIDITPCPRLRSVTTRACRSACQRSSSYSGHELRQPLTGIATRGAAGMNWRKRTSPELDKARECFQSMISASLHANQIIAAIRELYKKTPSEHAMIQINDVVGCWRGVRVGSG